MNWLPRNVSSFGGDVDSIFALIFYVVGIWFVATQVYMLICLVRFHRSQNQRSDYIPGKTFSQLAWVLVPCALVLILDLWIDFRGADVWAKIKIERPEPDLKVHLNARQFNWTFTHPGPDGKLGTRDDKKFDNDLHVPVDKVVRVTMTAKDVIHSLFIPEMRLKQDIVPGREIPAWFKATQTGRFEIPCAELCGVGHTGMKGFLFVHSSQSYKKWLKENWPG